MTAGTDWAGLWFRAMESEFGEFTGIRFGRRPRGVSSGPCWEYLPHWEFDGIGGLAHLLRREGMPVAELPALREKTGPGRLWRAWALACYLLRKPKPVARWKGQGSASLAAKREAPGAVAVRAFSPTETRGLEERASALRVSLNTLLLWTLGRASLPWLDGEGQPLWMVPVNMRGGVVALRDTANHSAYLQIPVGFEDDEPARVHARIRDDLGRGWHWRSWSAIRLARYVGAGGVRVLYRLDRAVGRAWVGSFSNLGVWGARGDAEWFFCPPVSANNPLGAGAVICDGALTLTLHAHPVLGWDAGRARELLTGWERGLGTIP